MTMGNMNVMVEVWPVMANEYGIWLLSGEDAWRSDAIGADSEPHFETELILATHDLGAAQLLHSTSWRPDGASTVLTYIAVFNAADPLVEVKTGARPIPVRLLEVVGKPTPHDAAEVPIPRYIDVLHHALRHLRFLQDTDETASEVLTGWWERWLGEMSPALAGMYRR